MTLAGTHAVTRPARVPGVLVRGRTETLTVAEAAAAWSNLAASAIADNPFFDPGFLQPASAALGADVELVAARTTDGRIGGMVPIVETRLGPITPALSVWVHDYGPLGTPVVAKAGGAGHLAALVEAALERAGPNRPLLLPEIPTDGPVAEAITAAAERAGRDLFWLDRYVRAALDRNADGIDPRAVLPKKRRHEYGRLLRRLAGEGPVTTEHAVAPDDILRRFDDFVELERAGWKGRAGTAMGRLPGIVAFAREAVANLAPRGAVSIVTLSAGGRPAAILICLHEGATAFTWKIAYDETLARYSPGALVMLEAPRFLFADERVTLIDSCATPNHPMIDHLWRGRIGKGTLVIAPERRRWLTALGRTGHIASTELRAIARGLRRQARRQPHKDGKP